MSIPLYRYLLLFSGEVAAVHEGRTSEQLPNEGGAAAVRVVIAVHGTEAVLEAPPQRAREDSATDGAAEATSEAAEGADEAGGHVVGAWKGEVQDVGEGVVEGGTGEEAIEEDNEDVEGKVGVDRGGEGERKQATGKEHDRR